MKGKKKDDWIFYLRSTPNLQLAAISTISGIVSETIGGLYFFMYKKSLEQLNYFYNYLYNMQNIMLALKVGESIKNEEKQIEIKEKIILTLLSEKKIV